MNHIGERIREFRKAAGISQEKLAEQLGVSSQAVSKWETCAAMPDLTMVVPLSALLGVTTDRLLGTDDIRRRELENQWHSLMRQYGESSEECIEHERRALLEFPDDFTWNYRLAVDLIHSTDSLPDPDQRERRLDSALLYLRKLQKQIADGKAEDPHGCVDSFLVQALTKLNRREKARKIAENSPRRNELLKLCLTGEEREMHVKSLILDHLHDLFREILSSEDPDTLEAGYRLAETVFPDILPMWLRRHLFEYGFTAAKKFTEAGRHEEAAECLHRFMNLAAESDAVRRNDPKGLCITYENPLLHGVRETSPIAWAGHAMAEFRSRLSDPAFDPIRDRPDFPDPKPVTEA